MDPDRDVNADPLAKAQWDMLKEEEDSGAFAGFQGDWKAEGCHPHQKVRRGVSPQARVKDRPAWHSAPLQVLMAYRDCLCSLQVVFLHCLWCSYCNNSTCFWFQCRCGIYRNTCEENLKCAKTEWKTFAKTFFLVKWIFENVEWFVGQRQQFLVKTKIGSYLFVCTTEWWKLAQFVRKGSGRLLTKSV